MQLRVVPAQAGISGVETEEFGHAPYLSAAVGGTLIGLAAVLLMLLSGRVAGISGIVGALLPPKLAEDWRWRFAFIAVCCSHPSS